MTEAKQLYPALEQQDISSQHRIQTIVYSRGQLKQEQDIRSGLHKKYKRVASICDIVDTYL